LCLTPQIPAPSPEGISPTEEIFQPERNKTHPYHEWAISEMTSEQLQNIIDEYNALTAKDKISRNGENMRNYSIKQLYQRAKKKFSADKQPIQIYR